MLVKVGSRYSSFVFSSMENVNLCSSYNQDFNRESRFCFLFVPYSCFGVIGLISNHCLDKTYFTSAFLSVSVLQHFLQLH